MVTQLTPEQQNAIYGYICDKICKCDRDRDSYSAYEYLDDPKAYIMLNDGQKAYVYCEFEWYGEFAPIYPLYSCWYEDGYNGYAGGDICNVSATIKDLQLYDDNGNDIEIASSVYKALDDGLSDYIGGYNFSD